VPEYHFIGRVPRPEGAGPALYGCDDCGVVVEIEDFDRHDAFHGGHVGASSPGPNRQKAVVCEALIAINEQYPDAAPIIPPTAIDWIGNAIVSALQASEVEQ
jgi:hypothetical protein